MPRLKSEPDAEIPTENTDPRTKKMEKDLLRDGQTSKPLTEDHLQNMRGEGDTS